MNFIELAKKRCSVRKYTDQPVEAEKLEKILEAAHVAPTAANRQPVHLIAVQSKEGLSGVGRAANIYNAPLAIIVCADRDKAWVRPYDSKQVGDIDASILTDHMMLQATENFTFRPIWSQLISWLSATRRMEWEIRTVLIHSVFRSVSWFLMKSCK